MDWIGGTFLVRNWIGLDRIGEIYLEMVLIGLDRKKSEWIAKLLIQHIIIIRTHCQTGLLRLKVSNFSLSTDTSLLLVLLYVVSNLPVCIYMCSINTKPVTKTIHIPMYVPVINCDPFP